MYNIKLCGKTLKFGSKRSIKIISDKFKHSDTGFKYFIGYKDDYFIKPFMIEDDSVLVKYRDIWNKIKEIKGMKFHSNPGSDEKYIKAKVKIFNSVYNTNLLGWWSTKRRCPLHLYSLYKYWFY